MRVAVVTAYCTEARPVLERAVASVRTQGITPGLVVDLIVVADGYSQPWLDRAGVQHVTLPRAAHDYGDTPRAVGIAFACSRGYDAITLLDADCHLLPGAIQTCIDTADHMHVPLVIGRRLFAREDGSLIDVLDEAVESHVDTNCYFFLRGGFGVLLKWAAIPPQFHVVGDRVIRLAVKVAGLAYAVASEPTVVYRTNHAVHYLSVGEQPPAGAKDLRQAVKEMWTAWDGLERPRRVAYCAALGFGLKRARWAITDCALDEA